MTFDHACLVVVGGAKVSLQNVTFTNADPTEGGQPSPGISVVCQGEYSHVDVSGCMIRGGEVGVIVRSGGCMDATNFTIQHVSCCGIHAQDKSQLKLTSVAVDQLHSLRQTAPKLGWSTQAIRIFGQSSAELTKVTVADSDVGVVIDDSKASLTECSISGTLKSCVQFRGGAEGTVKKSKVSNSRSSAGIVAHGMGTKVHVEDCTLQDHAQHSVSASNAAEVEVKGTRSVGNKGPAALRAAHGAKLKVSKSFSHGDRNPGAVEASGGTVVIEDVKVDGMHMSGTFTEDSMHNRDSNHH